MPGDQGRRGPSISGLDPWAPSAGRVRQLLTDDERAQLAIMSSTVRFKKREIIYREGDPAEAVFNISTGVVAAYKEAPDGRKHIAVFLFADDLSEGKFTNSTKAITDVIAYRFQVTSLRTRLSKDAKLEFYVICKLRARGLVDIFENVCRGHFWQRAAIGDPLRKRAVQIAVRLAAACEHAP